MYWFSHSPFVYFVCAPMLFFCVASFPTASAFLVAPSYTTSPVLEKTLSFETFIRPLCASFELRCFPVSHRFLRPPHSSLLRLTPRRLSWKTRSHLTLSFCPLCTSFVLRCFSVLHRFLRPPHSSLLPLTPRRLSWKTRSHLTLSFALWVLRMCSDVVFLCCIVSYARRIPRCSLLHHVTCLGLEKTLSFDTLVCPSCTSFALRFVSVLHRFLRPLHSWLLRLTPCRPSCLAKF